MIEEREQARAGAWGDQLNESRPIAEFLRARADAILQSKLKEWRGEEAERIDLRLAVNPFWRRAVDASTLNIENLPPEADPIRRMGTVDARLAADLPGIAGTISAFRRSALQRPNAGRRETDAAGGRDTFDCVDTVGRQRPKATLKTWKLFFEERVRTWPDDQGPPNEAADLRAAKAHLAPGWIRPEFRQMRAEHTPEAWRKQGRRKTWGELKS